MHNEIHKIPEMRFCLHCCTDWGCCASVLWTYLILPLKGWFLWKMQKPWWIYWWMWTRNWTSIKSDLLLVTIAVLFQHGQGNCLFDWGVSSRPLHQRWSGGVLGEFDHLNHLFHTDNPQLEAELSLRTVKDRMKIMLKQFHKQENRKLRK